MLKNVIQKFIENSNLFMHFLKMRDFIKHIFIVFKYNQVCYLLNNQVVFMVIKIADDQLLEKVEHCQL